MSTENRFLIPGIAGGITAGLFVISQIAFFSETPEIMVIGFISQLLSWLGCILGVILLAFALGKPGEKRSVTMVMQEASNPIISKLPKYEQQGGTFSSNSQNHGALMLVLSLFGIAGGILFGVFGILSSMGSGLGFSGGSCEGFCETSFSLSGYSFLSSVLLFFGGLIALARPWAWFSNQTQVVVVAPPESSQEDLSAYTVVQLKEKLKEKGLAVSGKKDDLIARLTKGGEAQITVAETAKTVDKVIHKCISCNQSLRVPVNYAGRITCPSCNTSFDL